MAGAIEEPWRIEGQEWRSQIPDDMVLLPNDVLLGLGFNPRYGHFVSVSSYITLKKMMTKPASCLFVTRCGNIEKGNLKESSIDGIDILVEIEDGTINPLYFYEYVCINLELSEHILRGKPPVSYKYILNVANEEIYNINRKYETITCHYPPLKTFIQLGFDRYQQPTNPIKIGLTTTVARGFDESIFFGNELNEPKTIKHLIDVGSTFYAFRNNILDAKPGPETPLAVLARREFERLPEDQRRRIMDRPPAGLESALRQTPLFTHMHTSR